MVLRILLVVFVLSACTSDVPPVPESFAVPVLATAFRIDVSGVVDEGGGRRAVTLLDGRGERRDGMTDGHGRFTFPRVAPPYDLAIAGEPRTVVLGIRRADPWISEGDRVASRTVRVDVRLTEPSEVTAVTVSRSGTGVAKASGSGLLAIEVEHRARRADERVVVHVLVGNADGTAFAYARRDDVAATPIDAVPVPLREATVRARGAHVLPDWRWSTELELDLGGGAFGFPPVEAPGATMLLPAVPGAKLRARVAARHPRSDEQGGFHRSAEAWSGAVPGPSVGLDIAAGPEIVPPGGFGGLPADRVGTGSFTWMGSSGFASLRVADASGVRIRVLTDGQEVSLERLAALGVPKLERGEHLLDLTTTARGSVDEATSPDRAERGGRFERARAGSMSSLRVPFVVR